MEEIRWRSEIDDKVWDGNYDTFVSAGGQVATIPTAMISDWLQQHGFTDGNQAVRAGWAVLHFIGQCSAGSWNIKVALPDETKDHIVFALLRQYIINKIKQLQYSFQYWRLPRIDVQIYCNKTKNVSRIEDGLFWLKTGHRHKNGLTQLSAIMVYSEIDYWR